ASESSGFACRRTVADVRLSSERVGGPAVDLLPPIQRKHERGVELVEHRRELFMFVMERAHAFCVLGSRFRTASPRLLLAPAIFEGLLCRRQRFIVDSRSEERRVGKE